MAISHEIPTKRGHRTIGLSRKDDQIFWQKEQNFNCYWYYMLSGPNLMIGLVLSAQLFLFHFDVDNYTYVLVQALNVFHCTYMVFYFLHSLYTTNLFVLQTIHFFSVKFKNISRQLGRLNESKKIHNKRIAILIGDYQQVQLELVEVNDFFKNFLGVNMVSYFFYSILMMFLSIFIGWAVRLALLSTVLVMFLTVIFVPFAFGNTLSIDVMRLHFVKLKLWGMNWWKNFSFQIHIVRRRLENIAFRRTVGVLNRQKIESICNLSERASFTCFDWFLLGSHKGLMVSNLIAAFHPS